MALWKNTVKNNGNAACKNKRQHLKKGMFVETSTETTPPPISLNVNNPSVNRGKILIIILPLLCG